LALPQAPRWATISCVALSIYAPTTATDQLYVVWKRRTGKSTMSDHRLIYIRYYNLVCVLRLSLRRSDLGLPQAPHWATISCVAPSIYASTTAPDQLYFGSDSSNGKSTVSDHRLTYKRYHNLVCVLRRSNLGRPQAPHWATMSCVAVNIRIHRWRPYVLVVVEMSSLLYRC
jgi:hypothetical protein